jgi:hypothetical protein
MTPEQAMMIRAVADLINHIGTLPFGTLLAVLMLGPWLVMTYLNLSYNRRFERVVRMYESNVRLVEDYKALLEENHRMLTSQQDLIIHTTAVMINIKDAIDSNLFCPLVRQQTRPKEVHG